MQLHGQAVRLGAGAIQAGQEAHRQGQQEEAPQNRAQVREEPLLLHLLAPVQEQRHVLQGPMGRQGSDRLLLPAGREDVGAQQGARQVRRHRDGLRKALGGQAGQVFGLLRPQVSDS